ncbi:MAG: hypothetical protein HYZ68_04745 [Chloroflexi bacterium]|nr:hypothetical protein [Chloroflexota bacterium]
MKRPKRRIVPQRSGSLFEDYLIPILLVGLLAILLSVLLVVLGALTGVLSLG